MKELRCFTNATTLLVPSVTHTAAFKTLFWLEVYLADWLLPTMEAEMVTRAVYLFSGTDY